MTDTPTLRTLSSATVEITYSGQSPRTTEVSLPHTGPFKQLLTVMEGSYTSHDMRGLAVTSGVTTYNSGDKDDDWNFEGQQVFEGTLCGRQGAFVWHERAHKRGGSVSASCEILEGSGTGELAGVTGRGRFSTAHHVGAGQPIPGKLVIEMHE